MDKSQSVFGDTNLLLGIMRNEGFLYFNQPEIDDGVSEHKMQKMIRTYVRNMYQYHRQKIYEILLHHYSDWGAAKRPRHRPGQSHGSDWRRTIHRTDGGANSIPRRIRG